VIAVGALILAVITFYIIRRGTKEDTEDIPKLTETLPLDVERSITQFDAQKSKKELRLLDVEREILSYGIRRLYEAQAEGKLTETERETMAQGYKQRMLDIRNSIEKNESVVALHELESMQEDLVKLFNDRFDEINKKIGGLRMNLQIQPKPEIPKAPVITPEAPSSKAQIVRKKPSKPSKPRKTEAEERIEQIKSEVEKVLERLGQIETEA
jgi:hypothetical protein